MQAYGSQARPGAHGAGKPELPTGTSEGRALRLRERARPFASDLWDEFPGTERDSNRLTTHDREGMA
jgi:hypothetical protein